MAETVHLEIDWEEAGWSLQGAWKQTNNLGDLLKSLVLETQKAKAQQTSREWSMCSISEEGFWNNIVRNNIVIYMKIQNHFREEWNIRVKDDLIGVELYISVSACSAADSLALCADVIPTKKSL